MCEHGNEIVLEIFGRKCKIDSCIVPLVQALNDAGIYTVSCCCGHGEEYGHIWLRDGRVLVILDHLPEGDVGKDIVVNKIRP
jgi:hypothetical protein